MIVTSSQVDLLARLLDVSSLRHETIAQNVANVNTPGFRHLDVKFDDAFNQFLSLGKAGEALQVKPQVVQAGGGLLRADGNNVDIDQEMGSLTKNSMLYRVYAQVLAVQLASWRSAISGK